MCRVAVKRTIKIHIAGQQYVLRSDADERYVQSLADFVNARINALKGNRQVATQSDVVLAALKLADELQHEQQQHTQLRTQARQQVWRMLERLNAHIERSKPNDPSPPAAVASQTGQKAEPKTRTSRSRRVER